MTSSCQTTGLRSAVARFTARNAAATSAARAGHLVDGSDLGNDRADWGTGSGGAVVVVIIEESFLAMVRRPCRGTFGRLPRARGPCKGAGHLTETTPPSTAGRPPRP